MSYQRSTLAEFSRAIGAIYAVPDDPFLKFVASDFWIHDPALPPEELAFLDRLLDVHRTAVMRPAEPAPISSCRERGKVSLFEGTDLTPREKEILHWIADGKRNSEIAAIVACSVRTVSKHVEHILAKLGAETRLAAVQAARDRWPHGE